MMGVGQWVLLHSRVKNMWRWIPATALGLPAGILFGFCGGTFFMSITVGLLTSIIQWLAIRKNLDGSLRWILISTISWASGMTIALYLVQNYLGDIDFLTGNYSKIGLITGIIIGVISGGFVESAIIDLENLNDVSKSHAS